MIFHILKYWSGGLLHVLYKNIQVRNIGVLKTKDPVIIAMNHPNAFTDPVLFTASIYPLRLHYLARGDAFKPRFLAWFLESIGLIPIFRIQDGGKEGLMKNDAAYRRVNQVLKRGGKVIVFAEGLCVQERRLRPLKKGVARMVFGAYEELNNPRLKVVPVGVNYSKPDKMRSNVFYNVGEPIMVRDFMQEYHAHPARAYNAFLEMLAPKMRELVIHIDDPANDEVAYMAEMLCKKSRMREKRMDRRDLALQFAITNDITEALNKAAKDDPQLVEDFRKAAKRYFCRLKEHRLRDWLIDPIQNSGVTQTAAILRLAAMVPLFPLFAIGYAIHVPALLATDRISKKISPTTEFYSSFAIGAAMVTFLLTYGLLFSAAVFFLPNVWWAIAVCIASVLCGMFAFWYRPFMLKTMGMLRILKNAALRASLAKERSTLVDMVNKFYTVKTASTAH